MEEKAYLYALLCSGIFPRTLKGLLAHFQSWEALWNASLEILKSLDVFPVKEREKFAVFRRTFQVKERWSALMRSGISVVGLHEKEYPELLRTIADPPPLLFYQGDLYTASKPTLAVVGSRNATVLGKFHARSLAAALASSGFVVVSGLARGIDMAAHQGALDGGETIAVLGSGIDCIYPPENENLAKRIKGHGALVSEFPPGTPAFRGNFPRRNRIISGLSLGVLVVEAGAKSGALITSRFALEQGREVFAVPGDPGNPLSRGTNALIQDGSKLVQDLSDILEEFPYLDFPRLSLKKGEGVEAIILNSLQKENEGKIIEHFMEETRLPVQQITGTLLLLETKGLVSRLPGNLYVRA